MLDVLEKVEDPVEYHPYPFFHNDPCGECDNCGHSRHIGLCYVQNWECGDVKEKEETIH